MIIVSLAVLLFALFMSLMDKRLVPVVMSIEEHHLNARLTRFINEAVAYLADTGGLKSADFYTAEHSQDGKILSLTANTVLINDICARLSDYLLKALSQTVTDTVNIPIGALTGIKWFANFGPSYNIRVMPVGAAQVEYNTSFASAGINQINFQVWLSVTAHMQVVNPLQTREISVSRSVPLVNTVFAGDIPGVYLSPGVQ